MTIHRFTVNVPNPGDRPSPVELRLERAQTKDLAWLAHRGVHRPMEIKSAGIAGDPCAEQGRESLKLELKPFTSRDVYVVVNAAATGRPSVAAYHLIDHRDGKDVGGVLLVCTDPPFAEPASTTVSTAKPCPAVLAKALYAIGPGGDPATSAAQPILAGSQLTIVAPITNPTNSVLKDTRAYLEHLGTSNAEFSPGTWRIGTMAPGAVFYATWSLRASSWQVGTFAASIVVTSQGTDPVRLASKFAIARENR